MSALVRVVSAPEMPAILTGPGFGRWEATPRGDGTFGVRKAGVGVVIISGSFSQAEARRAADELNTPSKPKCICDDAFPGPIDARHCPACGAQNAAPKLREAR